MMNYLLKRSRILIASFLALQIVLGYLGQTTLVAQAQLNTNTAPAANLPTYQGVDQSISAYLCAPDESNLGASLFTCIKKVYRFGVAFGAIALVFFVVVAGYLYIVGGEASKAKGKAMFISTLTGMVIILSSYVLLSFINPDLVKIKPIQAPIFSASDLPKCADVGYGVNCVLPDGQVSTPGGGAGTPGSASEAKYKDLIAKYAAQNNLEYCALSALMQKESSFDYLVVSNPPPHDVDTSVGSPPSYNVTSAQGHGIGLTQIYIYPGQTSRPGGEFGFNKNLTVQDLIDPETNISAGAHLFATKMRLKNNNLKEAYRAYTGGYGDSIVNVVVDMYTACKARG
ncbi:MAG TPA: transglycosylase SLT domain-containing protein [Patescibacteria group bacterium]|jgi:hypothetical protein|nr:transglycosylase SLT domain-containing protein [Patescibacteria group bacterium]